MLDALSTIISGYCTSSGPQEDLQVVPNIVLEENSIQDSSKSDNKTSKSANSLANSSKTGSDLQRSRPEETRLLGLMRDNRLIGINVSHFPYFKTLTDTCRQTEVCDTTQNVFCIRGTKFCVL